MGRPRERALAALEDLAVFPSIKYSSEPFLPRIWELRHDLSAYDAHYVALAEALDIPLLNCDRRMAKASGHRAQVQMLGGE
ncbi:MAG: type II toxin-antitoxin system VapC family toxin [Lacisediminihabitans sp.]